MPSLLEVKGLKAAYGATEVLHGIDFGLEPGRITAILGANGAGKTTTLRAICQMVRTAGSALFEGHQLVGRATEEVQISSLSRILFSVHAALRLDPWLNS